MKPGPGGLQCLLKGLLLLQSELAAVQPLSDTPQQGLVLRLQLSRDPRLTAVTSASFVQRLTLLTEALKRIPAWIERL